MRNQSSGAVIDFADNLGLEQYFMENDKNVMYNTDVYIGDKTWFVRRYI